MVLFALGAGVAIYEGIEKVRNPHPLRDVYVIYIVLAVAIALEGYSMLKAVRELPISVRNRA